jgi:hypothetical protein
LRKGDTVVTFGGEVGMKPAEVEEHCSNDEVLDYLYEYYRRIEQLRFALKEIVEKGYGWHVEVAKLALERDDECEQPFFLDGETQ